MKNLKNTIATLLISLVSLTSYGQMYIDEFYQKSDELLIHSIVYEFDSLSQDELNVKIKNWAGTTFKNMNEVLVSETKDQMVFRYITDDFSIKTMGVNSYYSWYFKMVVQVKDGKIKVSVYDAMNGFWAGKSGGISTNSGRYTFSDYFGKDGLSKKMYTTGLQSVKNNSILLTEELNKSIKSVEVVNTDW
jgi:hypothetical protein